MRRVHGGASAIELRSGLPVAATWSLGPGPPPSHRDWHFDSGSESGCGDSESEPDSLRVRLKLAQLHLTRKFKFRLGVNFTFKLNFRLRVGELEVPSQVEVQVPMALAVAVTVHSGCAHHDSTRTVTSAGVTASACHWQCGHRHGDPVRDRQHVDADWRQPDSESECPSSWHSVQLKSEST